MSLRGYIPRHAKRSYLGPRAAAQRRRDEAKQAVKRPPRRPGPSLRHFSTTKAAWTRPKPSQTTLELRAKKLRRDRLYLVAQRAYLARRENEMDQIALKRDGALILARTVHHIRGRHRTLLFDERWWCPSSPANDLWPHENIDAARRLGLIAQRGDWRREPGDDETKRIEAWMREKKVW